MSNIKLLHALFVSFFGIIGIATYLYFPYACTNSDCTQWLLSGLLKPLIWGPLSIAVISGVLLVFPPRIFKLWLFSIFSWGFPVSLYMVSQIDIRSSSIFSVGRGEAALLLGYFFGILTTLFVLGVYGVAWWRKRRGQPLKK